MGMAENKKKFNGIELNSDFDINMYDAFYRNYDSQIGRFWQLDPKPSDSISLYAFAFNNPMRYADPLGDTAIVGLNKSAARGLGHQVLIFQDKNRNWFVYSMGAKDEKGADLVSGRTGSGEVTLMPLNSENFKGLPEGPLTVETITNFLADNKLGDTKLSDVAILNTTEKQDETIAKNAADSKANFASGKEKYNLYTNNSSHALLGVLNNNTELGIPTAGQPRNAQANVVEYSKIQHMTPEQRKEYYYQKLIQHLRNQPD